MAKYGPEVQEKAFELFKIQGLPFMQVIKEMRKEYPTFCKGILTKWKNDTVLDWEGRYYRHCQTIAKKNDEERVKQFKPVLQTIQDIREEVYNQLVDFLKKQKGVITDTNIGHVLSSFVKLGELEYKMTGGGQTMTPVKQVINVLLLVIEKNPNVGPVFQAYKHEIEEAVFEMLKSEK